MFYQDVVVFIIKAILIAFAIGLVVELFRGRKRDKRTHGEIMAEPLKEELNQAQLVSDTLAYCSLCDQAVSKGVDIATRQTLVSYMNVFKKAGFEYPHNGSYAEKYGYTELWVIIYQEWAARHPEERTG